MNLRCDQYFVEDEKWHEAADHYGEYLEEISNHGKSGTLFHRDNNSKRYVVLLELGVGFNTPVLRSLSTRRKLRKNMVKQQIQGYLFNKSTKYGERRCA